MAVYDYRRRRTEMTGKPFVVFTREDAVLVCRRATGEFDEAGDVRHAVCEGDVKLTKADRQVNCSRAIYEAVPATVTCPGPAVLREGESVTHGEDLVYDLDGERVSMRRVQGTLVQKPGQPLPVPKGKAR